jgi:hypothetical protein
MGYHGFVELGSEKVLSNGEYMHSADAREKPSLCPRTVVCSLQLRAGKNNERDAALAK